MAAPRNYSGTNWHCSIGPDGFSKSSNSFPLISTSDINHYLAAAHNKYQSSTYLPLLTKEIIRDNQLHPADLLNLGAGYTRILNNKYHPSLIRILPPPSPRDTLANISPERDPDFVPLPPSEVASVPISPKTPKQTQRKTSATSTSKTLPGTSPAQTTRHTTSAKELAQNPILVQALIDLANKRPAEHAPQSQSPQIS